MSQATDRALVYCEGAFGTTNGKTAHGLIRRCGRYLVLGVIDSRAAGRDAGELLDGRASGVPIHADLAAAVEAARRAGRPATHLVVGLAPDGGRLSAGARADLRRGIELGLHVVCGLHDFLSEDPELAALAQARGVELVDVRKPPPRSALHFFSGVIEQVKAPRIALLGTDSAVGKRTTAWLLVDALRDAGCAAVMVGTGQTAWLQGADPCIIMDSLVNDFVAGEIEHAVHSAWADHGAELVVIEGQGSLLNPAYPGGMEILAAARPAAIVLQHAPGRRCYDGFPDFPLHPLPHQIKALEVVSGRPVVAICVNHEGLAPGDIEAACRDITAETGLPAFDVLTQGARELAEVVRVATHSEASARAVSA